MRTASIQQALACFPALAALLALAWAPGPARATDPLEDWTDFDAAVASLYGGFLQRAPMYPPASIGFTDTQPPLPFDPAGFPGLTNNVPAQTLLGFPAWSLTAVETQLAARVWITFADGLPLHTNAVPTGFDPAQWSRDAYGNPPAWLTGTPLATWYALRTRERIRAGFMLIPEDQFAAYRAALSAAQTNPVPPDASYPVAPDDTNRVAFARTATGSAGTFDFDLYTPADLPVDIFRRDALPADSLWDYAGTVQTLAPFTPSAVAGTPDSQFLVAARADIDADGDGLPDGLEALTLGTNPDLADTDGDGLPDRGEIYRYGISPLLRDTDGDGQPDGWEVFHGLNPLDDDDATLDPDSDGLTNWQEFRRGTDPHRASTAVSTQVIPLRLVTPLRGVTP